MGMHIFTRVLPLRLSEGASSSSGIICKDFYEPMDAIIDEVCYFILSSDGPKGLFALHPTKHELMTNQELDRELRTNYHVIIKATEECINPIDEQAAYNDSMLDSSMLKINVNVNDIDDNPPEFIKRVFTGMYSLLTYGY